MPFIKQERRNAIAEVGLKNPEPGDRCYIFYKAMVDEWKADPRWSTAHNIYKDMLQYFAELPGPPVTDDSAAYLLAWQVFFNIYVMDYEQKKRLENGDI